MYEEYERIPSYPIQSTDGYEEEKIGSVAVVAKEVNSVFDSGFSSSHFNSVEALSSGYDPTDVENVYSMDHKRRGHLAVINNRRFDKELNLPERFGTDMDASNIYSTFKKLGFEINIHTDLTCFKMLRLLINYADMNHEDCDCFAVAILSHGDEGFVYGTDGVIDVKKLVEPLAVSKTLVGKPKLFFIQACQGFKLDDGIDCTDAEVDRDKDNIRRLPKQADFLYAYSTVPGFFAFRNTTNGSFFFRAIAKIFEEHGNKLEIIRLLTRVSRKVAVEFESSSETAAYSNKKQMPCVISTLTKDLYFPPKISQ